jgi:competence protein ComEC
VQIILGLGLAPLTIAWFTQISVIAPLTNLLAIPVFSIVVMPLTLLGAITVIADAGAGSFLLHLAAEVLAALITGLERAAAWPWAIWKPPPVNATGLMLAGLAVLILCWRRPVPARWAALLGLLPVLAGTGHPPSPGTARVVVMDVGQGLAVLVQTAGHALLYDAGPSFRSRDAGSSVALPVMRHFGIRRLDALLISHGDADHRGGGASVLREFPRAQLIATDRSVLEAEHFQPCRTGLAWSWDGVHFEILAPAGQGRGLSSENDASCVLLIRAGGHAVLLPGDIERRREQALVGEHALTPVDLLLAPHHGSRTSSSVSFVAATRPRFLVVSAGYRNRWGFPAGEVVQRWREARSCVMTTAEQGALVFEFSGKTAWPLRRRQRVDGARIWTLPPASAARELRRCVKLADGRL